jgi:chromosomal replication initiation ATPase DnaA
VNAPTHPDAIVAALSVRGLLDLADAVCARRGVTRSELCGSTRTKAATAARHELWWLIRHHPERGYSYSDIARIVRRDHTSVLYGIAAHQRRHAAPAVA